MTKTAFPPDWPKGDQNDILAKNTLVYHKISKNARIGLDNNNVPMAFWVDDSLKSGCHTGFRAQGSNPTPEHDFFAFFFFFFRQIHRIFVDQNCPKSFFHLTEIVFFTDQPNCPKLRFLVTNLSSLMLYRRHFCRPRKKRRIRSRIYSRIFRISASIPLGVL